LNPVSSNPTIPQVGSSRPYELILVPIHQDYYPHTALYDYLSFVLGELEYSAYAVYETLGDWPGFWHECQRSMELMDEAVDDNNAVEQALSQRRHQLWETVAFQSHLQRFYEIQSQMFYQYLGPALQTHYFAYECHRPGSVTLVAWRKDEICVQPAGGFPGV
jgi:hypothetical protein